MSESTQRVPMAPKVVVDPGSPTSSADTLSDGEIAIEKCGSKMMETLDLDNHTEKSTANVDLEAQSPQPRREPKILAGLRYAIFTLYRRLFTLVFLANAGVFIAVMLNLNSQMLLTLVNATSANLLVCGLARQPLVVNAIFKLVLSMPRSAPLPLRRVAAKVYHYGGVHSGCGVAALVWYIGFVGVLSRIYWDPFPDSVFTISTAPVVLSYVILVLLLAIILVAHPAVRMKRHDYFELTHRFSGWLVVALFFVLLMVVSHDASQSMQQPLGKFLISLPAFWALLITIAAIIQPWLLLRKVAVRADPLSGHATRLHFDHAITTFGKGIQVAKHPLRDWHSFATFPDPVPAGPAGPNGAPSFSCLVSKAGDWTTATIQNPPTHLWKRGVLIYGFAYAMRVFRRVIVVTTGSGIGPCLSFLGDDNRPGLRVLWQTRAPHKTYGEGVMKLVRMMDPNPIVLDTDQCGRIDMVPLILQQVKEFDAEAVCVISNPVLTGRIVYELEARGTPAFGPIFDS
ncbi:unnamed protein product [Penicillium salamii]|uniref:Integral membrane protein TmpA n=1 Tax=Penicillium salamii TaxID=1612424 RepID=A0A9W4P0M8_9EURO|nr:unnamed protein product [Penicillium salamii]CAG8157700.1 unnamed protein product [Penicillium salamii]CAG8190030.1 unnamed protein product [Penicillium salamii]CAG8242378.1 unnamed protein product [Penicillium salamii]CAG8276197.1 unnamed protein product [Penicillium salamii]